MNANNVLLTSEGLTSDRLEEIWMDTCPGCKQKVSALKHDFSLCTRMANLDYRINEVEGLYRALINLIRQGVIAEPKGLQAGGHPNTVTCILCGRIASKLGAEYCHWDVIGLEPLEGGGITHKGICNVCIDAAAEHEAGPADN